MPNRRMVKARKLNPQWRLCGIIPVTALCRIASKKGGFQYDTAKGVRHYLCCSNNMEYDDYD